MPRHLSRLLAAATLAGGLSAAESAPLAPLPPVSGTLAAQVSLPKIPGLPPLDWKVRLSPAGSGDLAFDATATAPGLELQCQFTLPRGEAPGTWKLVSATFDAASWWRILAGISGVKALPSDFEFSGRLALTGSGTWRGAEVTGVLHSSLTGATARSDSQHWSAAGLALESEVDLAPGRTVVRAAHLKVDSLLAAGIAARELVVDAAGAEGGRLAIKRAEVTALGGRITFEPFPLDPAKPVIKTAVEFPNIALAEVVPLLPQALKEAKGRVAGRVRIEWSGADGLVAAEGKLATQEGESAVLRLAPSSGLFTGRVPARIGLFLGLTMKNPAIDTLRRIELGEDALLVDRLKVDLFSLNGESDRSAQVDIVGRPTNDRDVKKITLTVNVTGPINQVVRLGVGQKATLQVR